MNQTERNEPATARELLTIEQLRRAWLRSTPVEFGDPILAHTALDRAAMFFPLGFPVSVTTNSEAVLEAARESWGCFERRFDTEPVRLKVAVTEGDGLTCPPTPRCRMRDHIVTNMADGDNFAVSDLSRLCAVIWTTKAAVEHRDYFRYFFLESTAMACISSGHATAIHAACVALDDEAILLCGDSGAGKTTLSYACACAGWTYVTDDGSYLVHGEAERLVAGNCHQARFRPSAEALFPHLRGREVLQRAGVGKPSIELPICDGDAIRISAAAKVRYMVFLRRDAGKQELAPFPRAVARMYLWQRAHCMPYQANRHLQAIDTLLGVETFELRYSSLDWAIGRLAQLVREGR